MEKLPQVKITAWGLKHGDPPKHDVYRDVRHLNNPFYTADLKDLTGFDEAVRAFVAEDPEWEPTVRGLIQGVLDRMEKGKETRMVIACTGGRHRSVSVAWQVSTALANLLNGHADIVLDSPHAGKEKRAKRSS